MDLAGKKCVPCEAGTPPMAKDEAKELLSQVSDWELVEEEGKLAIRKRFIKFGSYLDGVEFVNRVAKIAEEEGHHPDIFLGWRRVTVNLMTHAIGGLSENDFILAAKIDNLQREHERSEAK